jgi:hypothetical protein
MFMGKTLPNAVRLAQPACAGVRTRTKKAKRFGILTLAAIGGQKRVDCENAMTNNYSKVYAQQNTSKTHKNPIAIPTDNGLATQTAPFLLPCRHILHKPRHFVMRSSHHPPNLYLSPYPSE